MDTLVLFYNKCRLCLENPGFRNIFKSDDLPKEIFLCTGVKMHPYDRLPQKICRECYEVIKKAKELRVVANDNNSHLKSLFGAERAIEEDSESCETSDTEKPIVSKLGNNDPDSTIGTENYDTPTKGRISVRKDLCSESPESSTSKRKSEQSDVILDNINTCKKVYLDNDTVLFQCRVCQKTYDKWKKLYLHQRSHNKTIACPIDICPRKFVTKGDLKKHLRTHTGVKPFACDDCDSRFTQRCSLKHHMETIHGVGN